MTDRISFDQLVARALCHGISPLSVAYEPLQHIAPRVAAALVAVAISAARGDRNGEPELVALAALRGEAASPSEECRHGQPWKPPCGWCLDEGRDATEMPICRRADD